MYRLSGFRCAWFLCLAGVVLIGLCWPVAARAADGDAVAIVNGRPVSKHKMVSVLMDGYGLQVMQQLIVLELAKAETQRLGLPVVLADVDAEYDRALDRIAPEISEDGKRLSPEERRQSLEFLLQQKNISMAEFMLGMERNAHLRKVVERDFRVDEATLHEEYARTYGEKVQLRHIQIPVGDSNTLYEVIKQLEQGTDFADVARGTSQNPDTAPRGGLMEPFTFDDPEIAPALREQAFAMKPGEMVTAPLKIGRWWHVVKLEGRIPPAGSSFDEVRDQVEERMRERVIPEKMNTLVGELFNRANIRVMDSSLRRKFNKLMEENRVQAPNP